MGYEFEVWAWTLIGQKFEYIQKYAGDDFDEAMKIMKELKANGVACVKFEWR